VGTAALFGAFGLDWRASRDDGLYIPLAGFHAGFSVLRGAHDASDGLGNRLHLGVPFYVEVLGPGAGWHWLSADHGTRISLGARLAMPVLFAFGDVLAPSLERQDLSALAWGLGATGEVQACHRIWKETSGWSGLCFLGQAGFAYGSGGPVISVTLAFRLSVG
jgi:hypothetical protein